MFVLKKKLKPTCTAHYLGKGFPRACKNMHGHNYNYEVEIGTDDLNKYDMCIDFADIKEICDGWLQEHLDHKTLFSSFQTKAIDFWEEMGWDYEIFPITDENTTAENMAHYISYIFYQKLSLVCPTLRYVTIHIWETEGSEASYTWRFDDEL